jgi:hypothetical protein
MFFLEIKQIDGVHMEKKQEPLYMFELTLSSVNIKNNSNIHTL